LSTYASFKLQTNISDKNILTSALDGLNIKYKKEEDGESFNLNIHANGFRDIKLSKKGETYEMSGSHDRDFRDISVGKVTVSSSQDLMNSIHAAYNVFKTQQDMILKFGFTPIQDSLVVNNGRIQLSVQREGA